jgi:hypothetical protein
MQALHRGVFALMEVRIYTEQIKAKILIVNTGFRLTKDISVLNATSFCKLCGTPTMLIDKNAVSLKFFV